MKFEDVLQENRTDELDGKTTVGIDIGSRQAKAVLLHQGNLYTALIPTGFIMQECADELLELLLGEAGLQRNAIDYIVVTGYGRIALKFKDIPYRMVTEIACHGMGAHYLGKDVHTIIDIGGQDSKVIRINPENGNVDNFAMNDKCAAGTGRFLEKIANVLGYDVTEIGEVSLRADAPEKIDSTCVVFAESEVVSARAKGVKVENIAAGIHQSVAKRVSGLLNRVGIESNVLFTGGVSNNIGMKKAFEDLLGIEIAESRLNTVYAGALGAAVFAADYAKRNLPAVTWEEEPEQEFSLDLESFRRAQRRAKEAFIHKSAGKKAYVAYTCVYTPIEVLAAADVSYIRLLHRGSPDELIAGETLTQSMLCDFAKSIIGGFMKKTPEFNAIEKLYTFYTCGCMKSIVESVNELYVPAVVYNLPRKRTEASEIPFLASEIRAFKEDLEKLTGEKIEDEAIREKIAAYNLARQHIREIAEYRKGDFPLVRSSEFQELIKGFFTIPVEELLVELGGIKEQLQHARQPKKKKIRLLLTGGIIADGDDKITRILEGLGVEIVAEDNCTGIKPVSFQVPEQEDGDVYEQLAEAYLGKAPCSRMYPKEDMLDYTGNLAKEYDIDGVVVYYLKFCPSYSVEEKLYRNLFKKAGIPLIIIAGDYSVGDEGQIKTRLEAFVELIEQKKERDNADRPE